MSDHSHPVEHPPETFVGCLRHSGFDYHCHDCLINTVRHLTDALTLYIAHAENLIERVRVLEEGADWEYLGKCHDCTIGCVSPDSDSANRWAEEHSMLPMERGSRMYHAAYVTPIVKR